MTASRGTVVVTGASSGLGAEMARQFAALGYDLGITARRTDRLEELRDEILAAHPDRRVEVRALDVVDDGQVFAVFHELAETFGALDRVVVNAGLGKGAPLGTGKYYANRQTAMTNFVGTLAQMEAAMEVFRARGRGHLVVISSMSALRGMGRYMTTYAATKAGVASLAEGLRSELSATKGNQIQVSCIYPGYIRSEMNAKIVNPPRFMVDTEPGVRSMVAAIEAGKAKAHVPSWPWLPVGWVLKVAPLSVVRKFF